MKVNKRFENEARDAIASETEDAVTTEAKHQTEESQRVFSTNQKVKGIL